MLLDKGGDLLSTEARVAGHISSIRFNTQTIYAPMHTGALGWHTDLDGDDHRRSLLKA